MQCTMGSSTIVQCTINRQVGQVRIRARAVSFRFAPSYRDVEDILAERGIDVSYETMRWWALKFGGIIAAS